MDLAPTLRKSLGIEQHGTWLGRRPRPRWKASPSADGTELAPPPAGGVSPGGGSVVGGGAAVPLLPSA